MPFGNTCCDACSWTWVTPITMRSVGPGAGANKRRNRAQNRRTTTALCFVAVATIWWAAVAKAQGRRSPGG